MVDTLRTSRAKSLFILGYHWLSLATIYLVGDNREFEVLSHILISYTNYRWLIVSEHQRCMAAYPWLPLVAPSNHLSSG